MTSSATDWGTEWDSRCMSVRWWYLRPKTLSKDGMIFTIEPGIYIPGWGGVRIEDIVVMEKRSREDTDRIAEVIPHLCFRATIKPGHP